eukprot:4536377-Pyramimonas_sp.AAC.1
MAIGSLDCKVAKPLAKRRDIECTGEGYASLDQIAQDFTRACRLQPPPFYLPQPTPPLPDDV